MSRTQRRLIDTFPAYDPAGKKHTVYVSQDFIDTSNFEGSGEVAGILHLTLGGIYGQLLNRIDKGQYVTLLGVKLTSSDPRAR
jgi:hypothetical protein